MNKETDTVIKIWSCMLLFSIFFSLFIVLPPNFSWFLREKDTYSHQKYIGQ